MPRFRSGTPDTAEPLDAIYEDQNHIHIDNRCSINFVSICLCDV